MKCKRTYHTIDVGKIVASLFVVAIHSEPFSGVTEEILINVLARIAVPFFFLTSAFFFFKNPVVRQSPTAFLRRLAILYAFWFVVELPITILHSFIEPTTPFLHNLAVFARNFLFSSTFRGSWFIMSLAQGVLLVWVLSKRIPTVCILLIGAVSYLLVMAANVYSTALPDWWASVVVAVKRYIGEVQLTVMTSLLFCALGKWIADNEHRLTRIPENATAGVLALFLVIAVAEVFWTNRCLSPAIYESYLTLIVLTPCLFIWMLQHEVSWTIDYIRYRRYSTIFFFSHFIFVFIIVVVNKHVIPVNPLLKYCIVLLLCWLTARLMLHLSPKSGWRWLRYGY